MNEPDARHAPKMLDRGTDWPMIMATIRACAERFVDGKGETRSDAELVAAVNGGDWGAFDALYFRYKDWTFRLAWRFCGNETDAADTVQEVFVYLAKKFQQN